MSTVPWPWPLAPLFIGLLIATGAALIYLVDRHVVRAGQGVSLRGGALGAGPAPGLALPILPRFGVEVLPALALLWAALIGAYLWTARDYLWTLLPWATVTAIMLWPVGRRLGRPYLSYRSVGFVIGVLSMAYIPLAGFALTAPLSFGWKSVIFFGMVADLTVLGILPGLGWFIGRPIGMFFRPDLLFGDGRVLATGILSLVLGLSYLWGSPAMGVSWPIPKWDWYAILFAIVAGLIPIIAVRGMLKLLLRMRRMRDHAWTGWPAIIVREGFLVLAMLGLAYGFHNAFLGARPFTVPIFTTDPDFWPAVAITLAGAAIIVFARGGVKKAIGDPFIRETPWQTAGTGALLVLGAVVLFYGFMSILHMDPMHTKAGVNGLRTWSNAAKVWEVGIPLVLWGVIMLIPIRTLVQHYQRHAIVAQMAAVILPSQPAPLRDGLLVRMMNALLTMDEGRRRSYLATMNAALAAAPPEARATMTQAMAARLVSLPSVQRDRMMESQAAALGRLGQQDRVTRMADMMGAVSQLPEEQRRTMMQKMAALMA